MGLVVVVVAVEGEALEGGRAADRVGASSPGISEVRSVRELAWGAGSGVGGWRVEVLPESSLAEANKSAHQGLRQAQNAEAGRRRSEVGGGK